MHRAAASMRAGALAAATAAVAASALFMAQAASPVRAQAAPAAAPQPFAQPQRSSVLAAPSHNASTAALFSHAASAALAVPAAAPGEDALPLPSHTRCSLLLSPSEQQRPKGASGAEGALAAAEEAAGGAVMTDAQAKQCAEWKHKAIHQSRKVNFLFRALKKQGCEVDPLTFIHCTACDSHMNGALFHDADGYTATLMCGNRVRDYRTFETVLTHELLHAFDHCRAEVDPTDLRHHACMEVRASSLSGDCTFRQEAKLGNLSITGQQPRCVRRRAAISVMANPACPDAATARAAVDEVFERCYADMEPFKAIP